MIAPRERIRPPLGCAPSAIAPRSAGPGPLVELGHVDAVLVSVLLALELAVPQLLLGVGARALQRRDAVDDVHGQAEAIDLVLDGQIQRRVDVPPLLVA